MPVIFLKHGNLGLLAAAVILVGCGGGDGGGGPDPDPDPVLTTLLVTPTSAAVYNTAPGNAVALLVTAKDENGVVMTGLPAPTFSSGSTGVATVSPTGTVTGVGAGTTQVSVSLQHGGVTLTVAATITVQVPPLVANVGSTGIPQPAYVPAVVHLSSGGEVTWSFGPVEHSITFVSNGSPTNIPSLVNGSDSRTFPASGTFNYKCDFHPTMSGTVYVH